jgi:hypothetical protein
VLSGQSIVSNIETFTFLCVTAYPIDDRMQANPDEFRKIPFLLGFDLKTSNFLLHYTPNRSSIVLAVQLLALHPADFSGMTMNVLQQITEKLEDSIL